MATSAPTALVPFPTRNVTLVPFPTRNVTWVPSGHCVPLPQYALGLSGTGSSLSIAGAVVIFTTYFMIPAVQTPTRKLLIFLTVADLITATGYFVGLMNFVVPEWSDGLCVGQSAVTIFSNLVSYFWTIAIQLHIVSVCAYRRSYVTSTCKMVVCHCICWGLPCVITIIGLSSEAIGKNGKVMPLPWCFVSDKVRLVTWAFALCIAWELLTYVSTAVLYIFLKFHRYCLRRGGAYEDTDGDPDTIDLPENDVKFKFLWMFLYLLKIWGTVRVFITAVHQKDIGNTAYWMLIDCQCLFTSAQAFCNCLAFCVCDRGVRTGVRNKLCHTGQERQRLLNIAEDDYNRNRTV